MALKSTINSKLRSNLRGDFLFKVARSAFSKIEDHRAKNHSYSLTDMISSCLSIFALKSPSMLAHEGLTRRKSIQSNLIKFLIFKKYPQIHK